LKPWLEALNNYVIFILLFGSFALKPWLEALSESSELKLCLEVLVGSFK
jgi:hypothetical protein